MKIKTEPNRENPEPFQLPYEPRQEAHVGHCRSPEYNERVKNLTSEWNQKQQSFIPHASRSLLCIRFVAVAFWAKKQFF